MEINEAIISENHLPVKPVEELSFWGGVKLALLFLVVQLAATIPIVIAGASIYGMESDGSRNLLMLLGVPLAFGLGAWVLYNKRGLNANAFDWKPSFPILIALGLILSFSINYIYGFGLSYLPNYESMLATYKAMFANLSPLTLLIGAVIVGPICEEIIFRGIILEGFLQKYDPTKAIIGSAIIFSVGHLLPLQVLGTIPIGIVLGWIYYKTKSLWVCSGIHIINNGFALLVTDMNSDSSASYLDGNLLVLSVSMLIAAIIAYLGYKGMNKIFNK